MNIQKFIKDNSLSFDEGSRNTSVVCTIGFAQHLGLTKDELKSELSKQIKKDKFIAEELDRLFLYCQNKHYKNFWSTPEAKAQYKF